jgi:O-antigen ligase
MGVSDGSSDLAAENCADTVGPSTDRGIHHTSLTFFFLLVFVALYLGRPEDLVPTLDQLHLPEVTGIIATVCYIWSRFRDGRARFQWTAELKLMLALTAWFAFGVPFALWRSGSLNALTGSWLRILLIFFLFSQTILTISRVRKLLWVILGSEIFVASISLLSLGGQGLEQGERLKGASVGFLSGNEFSIVVAVSMPFLAAFLVLSRSFFGKIFMLASYGVLIAMVVLNASRGGVICLIAASMLVLTFELRGIFKARLVGIALIGIFLLISVLAPGVFWERMKTIWGGSSEVGTGVTESAVESSAQRSELLQRSIQFTLRHPVFGLGLGNFEIASGTSTGRSADWIGTHNTFTQISSEAGIPALLLFVALISVAIRDCTRISAHKEKRSGEEDEITLLARASVSSTLTLAVAFFFAALGYNTVTYLPFLIPVGLQLATRLGRQAGSLPVLGEKEVVTHGWSPSYEPPSR